SALRRSAGRGRTGARGGTTEHVSVRTALGSTRSAWVSTGRRRCRGPSRSAAAGDRAKAGVQRGVRARAPVAAAGVARIVHGVQQLRRVRAALVPEEVRRRGAAADELDVDVLVS